MSLPESDNQILRLSEKFYRDYPNPPYYEILKKKKRGYNCLLFQTHYEYFICIPYRTEIQHRYAYRFKNTCRSQKHKSGLDYSKMVIIKDLEFPRVLFSKRNDSVYFINSMYFKRYLHFPFSFAKITLTIA